MSDDQRLPTDLSWAAGGHASDVVLTALADGQIEIVPDDVRAHVETCTTCTMHLGNAALLSLYTGRELQARAEVDRVPERRPVPRLAIGLGLVVAALGAIPSLLDANGAPLRHGMSLVKAFHMALRRIHEPGNPLGLLLTYATALLLVGLALVVIRFLPVKETPR